MTTQHTPGPWYIDCQNESAAIGYRAIIDGDGYTVCSPSPMGQANARLIAAAPDLLAALEVVREYMDHAADQFSYEDIVQIRAAIAKATGAA
jgi:hypothetical protein